MDSFNTVDIGVAIILLVSALIAYARGFVHETLAIGSWVGATFVTIYAFPHVRPFVRRFIPVEWVADFIITGGGLFIVTLVAFSLITHPITKVVKESALNMLDRSLGFLFGILRGIVLICLVYLVVEWFMPPNKPAKWLQQARSMPLIEVGVGLMKAMVPEETMTAGKGKARGAGSKAKKLIESEVERTFRKMISPEPKKSPSKAPQDGYNQNPRREMDRAIQSIQ
jgi:membrane protein required for colicin V production